MSHSCTVQADSVRRCLAVLESPIVGAFAGMSPDGELRLVVDSLGSARIPAANLIKVQEMKSSPGGFVAGGLVGALIGTGIGVLLLEHVVPGEELEGGGSTGANLALWLPVIGGAVAGAFIGGAKRWREVPKKRLQP